MGLSGMYWVHATSCKVRACLVNPTLLHACSEGLGSAHALFVAAKAGMHDTCSGETTAMEWRNGPTSPSNSVAMF